MTINRSLTPALLEPGIKRVFGLVRDQHPMEWTELFEQLGSDRSFEEYQGLAGFGLVPTKTESGPVSFDDIVNGFKTTAINLTYALGFKVPEEMIEDELYGQIMKLPKELAQSVIDTIETVAANVYNRAFNASFTFGDGSALCVNDHALEGGGTASNIPTTPADLSETSFEQGLIDIGNFVNGRNRKRKFRAMKLLHSINDDYTAKKILGSAQEPETANNAINPAQGILPQGHSVNHFFTNTDDWFIRTNADGLVCQKRKWPADLQRDNDFSSGDMLMKTRFRVAFTAYDWRAIYGNAGA